MREILFRGKCVQTDEWIKGSLIIDENNRYYIGRAVTPKVPVSFGVMPSRQNGKTRERFIGIGFVMVNPETVGQFTGLTDKNGKPVFEGDILRPFDNEIVVVSWIDQYSTLGLIVYVTYTNKKKGKEITNTAKGMALLWDYDLDKNEVIGNVHDNPGLLEGADDERAD